jgi:hypothetical protein
VEPHVLGLMEIVGQCVVDQATQVSNVCSGADRPVAIRDRCCAIEARVDADQLGFAVPFGLHHKAKPDRMVLGWIPAHDEHHVRIGDIRPAVRHGPATESGGQTGHRGAMSKPGLAFVSQDAKAEAELAKKEVEFVGIRTAPDQRSVRPAIDPAAFGIVYLESLIA